MPPFEYRAASISGNVRRPSLHSAVNLHRQNWRIGIELIYFTFSRWAERSGSSSDICHEPIMPSKMAVKDAIVTVNRSMWNSRNDLGFSTPARVNPWAYRMAEINVGDETENGE